MVAKRAASSPPGLRSFELCLSAYVDVLLRPGPHLRQFERLARQCAWASRPSIDMTGFERRGHPLAAGFAGASAGLVGRWTVFNDRLHLDMYAIMPYICTSE